MDANTLHEYLRAGTNLRECFKAFTDADMLDDLRYTEFHNNVFTDKGGIKFVLNVIEEHAGTCGSRQAAWVMVQRQAALGVYDKTAYALKKALSSGMPVSTDCIRSSVKDWVHAVDNDPLDSVVLPTHGQVQLMYTAMKPVDNTLAKFLQRRLRALKAPRPAEDIAHLRVFPEDSDSEEGDAFWGQGKFGHRTAKALLELCTDMVRDGDTSPDKRRRCVDTGAAALRAVGRWMIEFEAYMD